MLTYSTLGSRMTFLYATSSHGANIYAFIVHCTVTSSRRERSEFVFALSHDSGGCFLYHEPNTLFKPKYAYAYLHIIFPYSGAFFVRINVLLS